MAEELAIETEVEQEPVETAVEDAVEGVEAEGSEEQVVEQEPQGAAQTWKAVKERLKDSPELHRQVKKALHFMEDANKRFPDGIGKASERLELLSQLDDNPDDPEYMPGSATIEEVISNTLAERTFWRDFDTAFQAGDAKVINQMIEANPASFQKLIPEAMDRFAEVNPEGFSTYICQSVAGYFDRAQIPLQIALLERVLPETSDDPGLKTVIEAVNVFKKVYGDIRASAAKKLDIKTPESGGKAEPQGGNQPSLEDRELAVRDKEWNSSVAVKSNEFAAAEALKHAGKTRFTPAELSSIQKFIRTEVNARIQANKPYQQKIKGFLKANNKTAYAMAVESEHKKIIGGTNGAASRAVADVLAKRKTAPKKSATTETGKTQQQNQTGNFEWISGSPGKLKMQVDWKRTTNGMYRENRAFVVGRTKEVRWK